MKMIRWGAIAGLLMCAGAAVWSLRFYSAEPVMKVHFLDVGQGDAIFVEAPNGQQMLVDGGIDAAVLQRLAEVMPMADHHIDVVVSTHPDLDHIGGLIAVAERFRIDLVVSPIGTSTNPAFSTLWGILHEKGIPLREARAGDQILLDASSGTAFEVLFPFGDVSQQESNDMSIVGRVVFGDSAVMLTGDAPSSVERMLVSSGLPLEADVLKAGHHGSDTSSDEGFVKAVGAQYGIISAGKDNEYGHPHPRVMETLGKNGLEILQTVEKGTLTFLFSRKEILKTPR